MDVIDRRRSVRAYQSREVEPGKIEELLRAAMQAPSAGNQRPWEFLVVRDRDALERLSAMSPYAKHIAKAPVALVLLGRKGRMRFPGNWEQDMGAAAENILLEATEQGLGAVWTGVCPVPERMDAVREQLSLPDELTPFAVIAVGYPEKEDASHFVDRFDPGRIHYETIEE
ncbi:MAG: nitroreductase family protein [Atopobiaceae bacterium]|jgi:nitroreductase|nr:nitroreductase family protein [Atopobiaceae bacterium]